MNPIILLAALGAVLLLVGGGSSASASATPKPAPPPAKPRPSAVRPSSRKEGAPTPARPKPSAVRPSSRKEGAPTPARPKPREQGDDLQALVNNYDSGATPVAPRPVDGPVVDVEVPVNFVGPAPSLPAKRFDETKARRLAGPLAKHIAVKKYDFSRQSLRDFQSAAALQPDGIYGPKSEGALRYYNGGSAPKALANPKRLPPEAYAPPN